MTKDEARTRYLEILSRVGDVELASGVLVGPTQAVDVPCDAWKDCAYYATGSYVHPSEPGTKSLCVQCSKLYLLDGWVLHERLEISRD